MTYGENSRREAHSYKDEALFVIGMVGIVYYSTIGIRKCSTCLSEGNSVLAGVRRGLCVIPIEVYVTA